MTKKKQQQENPAAKCVSPNIKIVLIASPRTHMDVVQEVYDSSAATTPKSTPTYTTEKKIHHFRAFSLSYFDVRLSIMTVGLLN